MSVFGQERQVLGDQSEYTALVERLHERSLELLKVEVLKGVIRTSGLVVRGINLTISGWSTFRYASAFVGTKEGSTIYLGFQSEVIDRVLIMPQEPSTTSLVVDQRFEVLSSYLRKRGRFGWQLKSFGAFGATLDDLRQFEEVVSRVADQIEDSSEELNE